LRIGYFEDDDRTPVTRETRVAVLAAVNALRKAASGTDNLMPFIYDAVKAYATLGEICDAMRTVFGAYEEVAIT